MGLGLAGRPAVGSMSHEHDTSEQVATLARLKARKDKLDALRRNQIKMALKAKAHAQGKTAHWQRARHGERRG
jgi:hypothetical protein